MNKCIFAGRISESKENFPNFKYTQNQDPKKNRLRFQIGVYNGKTTNAEGKEVPDYYNPKLVAWGKTADSIASIFGEKGNICVCCKAREVKLTDQQGQLIKYIEYVVTDFSICGDTGKVQGQGGFNAPATGGFNAPATGGFNAPAAGFNAAANNQATPPAFNQQGGTVPPQSYPSFTQNQTVPSTNNAPSMPTQGGLGAMPQALQGQMQNQSPVQNGAPADPLSALGI